MNHSTCPNSPSYAPASLQSKRQIGALSSTDEGAGDHDRCSPTPRDNALTYRVSGIAPSPAAAIFVAPSAVLGGDVRLSSDASVWFGAVLRADFSRIDLGTGSNVQDNAVLHTDRDVPVTIGREVSVGHGAIVHAATVGDRVLIGINSVLLSGTVVEDDCLIAAGSLVLEGTRIPAGSFVVGVPGRVVRDTTDEERVRIRAGARYYERLARSYAGSGTSDGS